MIHPFLENSVRIFQYILLWVIYALLQTFVLQGLVTIPFWILLIDSVIHAIIFGVIGILLWSVVKYGNFVALTLYQRLINNIALVLLSIACWLSVGYGTFYVAFGPELSTRLIPVLPVRGLIGILIYMLIMQYFRASVVEMDQQPETPDSLIITEEIKQKKDIQTEILERIAVKSVCEGTPFGNCKCGNDFADRTI